MFDGSEKTKRLFFALSVDSPWPDPLPEGRIPAPEDRHCTLAFLGDVDTSSVELALEKLPALSCPVGPVGVFDEVLLLPPRNPNVVAWHVQWLEGWEALTSYQRQLVEHLIDFGLPPHQHDRPWLPHVTVCRKPHDCKEWMTAFSPLPLVVTAVALYQSLGNSHYKPIWSQPVARAFEVIGQGSNLAFRLRGERFEALYLHAQTALAWSTPGLLGGVPRIPIASVADIVEALNGTLAKIDGNANTIVSNGDPSIEKGLLNWEMNIVTMRNPTEE